MQSDFLEYLLSFNLSPESLLTYFFYSLLRLAPICAITPFLGSKVVPIIGRMGFAIALSLIFMPIAIMTAKEPLIFNDMFLIYSLKEVLIGFVLAFLASMPFYAAEASGILIDYSRGSSSLMGQNVLTQNQASSTGIFYNYILIYMFYQFGGIELFFNAIVSSYEFMPVNKTLPITFYTIENDFWKLVVSTVGRIFALAIRFASPVLVAILMAEVFLGIANRLAPQVQISFLGIALKSLMGLLLLWTGWSFILKNMVSETFDFIKLIDHTIKLLNLEFP
ncbi:MAG: flagellar biosynthetic protein FliR [Rhabdochlamydiaceae bacterium]|nr:flagellar biosynthetic protein FliR [Candidatus Amphrikana amoebophyrae]